MNLPFEKQIGESFNVEVSLPMTKHFENLSLVFASTNTLNAVESPKYALKSASNKSFLPERPGLPVPETVTFTPPAESIFAAFPAASFNVIFTSDP